MEKARIGIIEDNQAIVELASDILQHEGHEIAFVARDREAALQVIGEYAGQGYVVDAVLLDGVLEKGSPLGEDARLLSPLIREKNIARLIIGFSASPLPEDVFDKEATGKNIDVVLEILQEFPEDTDE